MSDGNLWDGLRGVEITLRDADGNHIETMRFREDQRDEIVKQVGDFVYAMAFDPEQEPGLTPCRQPASIEIMPGVLTFTPNPTDPMADRP